VVKWAFDISIVRRARESPCDFQLGRERNKSARRVGLLAQDMVRAVLDLRRIGFGTECSADRPSLIKIVPAKNIPPTVGCVRVCIPGFQVILTDDRSPRLYRSITMYNIY
jgi:hypothetical protein